MTSLLFSSCNFSLSFTLRQMAQCSIPITSNTDEVSKQYIYTMYYMSHMTSFWVTLGSLLSNHITDIRMMNYAPMYYGAYSCSNTLFTRL